ncbi:MAG TPA: bifunctional serine/threonine-protein kinase/formylglycine-generating enzyme family protein, partial [Gemmatimonadota bacterium]|nr:bifunctional serine/threonine-protein kinase/formylglycine-generating enzyme family protein [Gemmatimonadota bacterium]
MPDLPSRLDAALEGRYRIERPLGEGGMATVYLAEDLKHRRRVAVKVLRPELASALGADRFVREIEITAGLTHPHILPVLDSGEADGLFYYVMPFVEGESLRERLDREGQLPIDEAVSIAEEVGEALESAHGHGVVHRDVKPDNILLIEGRVYVADFGIARAIEAAGGAQLTATGIAVGTPAYMSPEQATGSERVDHRTDVFALGCVLYEMLAGEPPHAGSTTRAVIAKVIADPATRLSTIRDSVPSHVEAAVHRALAKSPADRFPGIGDMLSALRGAPVAESSSTAASPRRSEPRRLALTLAVAAVLIGVTAAALLMQREDSAATLDQLRSLIAAGDFEGAYRVAGSMDAASIPDSVWARFTAPATIVSSPAGAVVSRRPYPEPDHPWEALGTTPLSLSRFPISKSLLRLEADGYHTALAGFAPQATDTIILDSLGTVADGWRTIPGDLPGYLGGPDFAFRYIAPNLSLAPTLRLEDFRIARYEVTNAEFKEFVDVGGYADASYWEYPFVRNGEVIPWAEAMAAMTDSTGRPGPSTWRFGTFPEGQDAFPVTGVSWYESAAYARWADRDLPTVYHWFRAASTWISDWMIPSSNMGGTGPMPVGASQGMSMFGIYDMAGNAREWAFNATEDGRFILGGGWSDSH